MNTDNLTTWLGVAQAAGVAAVTFYTTSSEDGTLNLKSPAFWLGLIVSVLVAIKAYWTNKTVVSASAPTPAPSIPEVPKSTGG